MKPPFALPRLIAVTSLATILMACTANGLPGTDVTSATGSLADFAVNSITLPQTAMDFAIDLIGDGQRRNQLSVIVSALISQNLNAQHGVTQSVEDGSLSLLLRVQNDVPTLSSSGNAGVT